MKLSIMGFCEATGTPDELARFTALFTMYVKAVNDAQQEKEIEKELNRIWETIQKGGDSTS